jgi:hypothetical protein
MWLYQHVQIIEVCCVFFFEIYQVVSFTLMSAKQFFLSPQTAVSPEKKGNRNHIVHTHKYIFVPQAKKINSQVNLVK